MSLDLDVIYNEDCLEGMKRIPDKSIDLVVTDPFLGSDTTCVEAVNTNRHYIGFESKSKNYDIACQRLDEVEGNSQCFTS